MILNYFGAVEIEPGKTYILETDMIMSDKLEHSFKQRLEDQAPSGTRFIILTNGIKIATTKPRSEDEGPSEEERSREANINEHIARDWVVGTPPDGVEINYWTEAHNEEGGVFDPEHKLQHEQAWEDYLRTQGAYIVCEEAERPQSREARYTPRNIPNYCRLFNRGNDS
jgi:hypothetical protein